MMDFFKFRKLDEEGGAGDIGTPSLVAKYKTATPGQTSSAPTRQPTRKGDKLNAKDEPKGQGVSESSSLSAIRNAAEKRAGSVMKPKAPRAKAAPKPGSLSAMRSDAEKRRASLTREGVDKSTEVNEISKKTLGNYVKAATFDSATRAMAYGSETGGEKGKKKNFKTLIKREKGIRKAVDRLTKEDVDQIDELKTSTLTRYGTKATQSLGRDPEKTDKRVKGIQTARYKVQQKSMKKEETVAEAEKMKGKDPCWKGYQMIGTKKKGGKEVPNCVPTNESVSYRVDVEGLPTMYIASKSPSEVKMNLRKLLKRADMIKSVDRVMDADVRKAFRLKAQGKDETVEEGVMKNIKRAIKGTDAESRAGDEATKMMKAQQSGDSAAATKYNSRYKKLAALTKKESVDEKLDPSMGAGEYVKDFEKSNAPQFKGKTKKERQKMAVAAYLGAKDGD